MEPKTWIYFNDYYNNRAPSPSAFHHVARHEIGHSFGLDHVTDCQPVMNGAGRCFNAQITKCDAQSAEHLYP
jgi:predicted Zn-dependent protease